MRRLAAVADRLFIIGLMLMTIGLLIFDNDLPGFSLFFVPGIILVIAAIGVYIYLTKNY